MVRWGSGHAGRDVRANMLRFAKSRSLPFKSSHICQQNTRIQNFLLNSKDVAFKINLRQFCFIEKQHQVQSVEKDTANYYLGWL